MGAFGDIGGVLMGKQSEGNAKTVSSPNINMTVMKVDEQSGLCQLKFDTMTCLSVGWETALKLLSYLLTYLLISSVYKKC